jgi:ribonuclease R
LARTPKSPDARLPPTRDELLEFLGAQDGAANKRDIARAMKLNAVGKLELKRLLKELQAEGLLARDGRRVRKHEDLPSFLIAEIVARDPDGDLIARPVHWDEEGEAPRILVPAGRSRSGERAAGVGDRVKLRVEPLREDGFAWRGRIIDIETRAKARVLGIYRALPDGAGRLAPVAKSGRLQEIDILPADRNGAEDGDLVVVASMRDGRFGRLKAEVVERLGTLKSERAVSLIALHAHEIPHVFGKATLAEAEAVQPVGMAGREDWRAIPLITIDPADAKDHDDAVYAMRDEDPANPGGFVLHIAIADVATYVRPGSAMDKEALLRGNSVYFPDRVVPMLPERISNDLCSLRPSEDRPALGLKVAIDRAGRKRRHSFHRVMMRSAAKLAYQQAQAAVDGHPDDTTGPLLRAVLSPLYAAYDALVKARDQREPLALDLPERRLRLDAKGHVIDVYMPERLDAHRLIEEMMILANVCAAETLEAEKTPLLYRIHDEPSLEKMETLRQFLATVGLDLARAGSLRPSVFNRVLAVTAESEHKTLINEVVLRSQAQAEYSPENIGHFGLNLRRYAHFTSPIRRYADLVVHRGLIRALRLGEDGLQEIGFETLRKIGEQISAAERRAMVAERETVDRLIAHHLADRIGETFTGRIGGVTRSGLFVKLDHTGADGFIPAATLGLDFFAYDEGAHALTGVKTGESYRLGDVVEVKLVEAAPVAGALRFEMISEGRFVKPKAGAARRGANERVLKRGAPARASGKPAKRNPGKRR